MTGLKAEIGGGISTRNTTREKRLEAVIRAQPDTRWIRHDHISAMNGGDSISTRAYSG